jgi:hypothetical protein
VIFKFVGCSIRLQVRSMPTGKMFSLSLLSLSTSGHRTITTLTEQMSEALRLLTCIGFESRPKHRLSSLSIFMGFIVQSFDLI